MYICSVSFWVLSFLCYFCTCTPHKVFWLHAASKYHQRLHVLKLVDFSINQIEKHWHPYWPSDLIINVRCFNTQFLFLQLFTALSKIFILLILLYYHFYIIIIIIFNNNNNNSNNSSPYYYYYHCRLYLSITWYWQLIWALCMDLVLMRNRLTTVNLIFVSIQFNLTFISAGDLIKTGIRIPLWVPYMCSEIRCAASKLQEGILM